MTPTRPSAACAEDASPDPGPASTVGKTLHQADQRARPAPRRRTLRVNATFGRRGRGSNPARGVTNCRTAPAPQSSASSANRETPLVADEPGLIEPGGERTLLPSAARRPLRPRPPAAHALRTRRPCARRGPDVGFELRHPLKTASVRRQRRAAGRPWRSKYAARRLSLPARQGMIAIAASARRASAARGRSCFGTSSPSRPRSESSRRQM